jgi:hypothetical protein
MNATMLTSTSLRLAGGLILLIGIGHIFMPEWGYTSVATAGMTTTAKEHFYFLGTYAICAFLLAFGILSVLQARVPLHPTTLAFSTVMALLWICRLFLEFAYPVRLRIFVLENPHPLLVLILATIAVCFIVAAWAGRLASSRLAAAGRVTGLRSHVE